jgi:arabinogalactan endo-1,4-beta-galactosidase
MEGIYRYADGIESDALQILADHGLNYARLRVWVDPADGYHDKAEILEMALKVKEPRHKVTGGFSLFGRLG